MKLLPATLEDIPELMSLLQCGFRGDKGWTTDSHLLEGAFVTREMLEKDISEPTRLLWKYHAEDDGTNSQGSQMDSNSTSGKIIACVYTDNLVETNALYVGRLCVHPDYQGRGLGKIIMKAVEERGRELQCRAITLQTVFGRTELIEWYKRQGFRLTGERTPLQNGLHGYIKVSPELVDLVTLQKDL